MVDNDAAAIFLEDPAGTNTGCRSVSKAIISGFSSWRPFTFTTTVAPHSLAYLYFAAYNQKQDVGNPTGLRLEFTSAYFTPQ